MILGLVRLMRRSILFSFVLLLLVQVGFSQVISLGSSTGKTFVHANPGDIAIFKMYVFNPGADDININIKTSLPNKYWKASVYPNVNAIIPREGSKFSCLDPKWIYMNGKYVKVCTFYLYVYVPMKVEKGRYNIVSTVFTSSGSLSAGTSALASQARNFVYTIDIMKDGEPIPIDIPKMLNVTRESMLTFMNSPSSGSYGSPSSLSSNKNKINVGNEYTNPSDRFKNVVSLDEKTGNVLNNKITGMATSGTGNIFISAIILIVGIIIIYIVFRK